MKEQVIQWSDINRYYVQREEIIDIVNCLLYRKRAFSAVLEVFAKKTTNKIRMKYRYKKIKQYSLFLDEESTGSNLKQSQTIFLLVISSI